MIKDIIEGHVNELFDRNKEFHEHRMDICRKCPLYKQSMIGPMCNNKLWLNVSTGEVSSYAKQGFTRGCGCRLDAKTRNPNNRCPNNKW